MDEENEILASFTFGKENLKTSLQNENNKQLNNGVLNNKNSKLNSLNNKKKSKKKNINTEIIGNSNYFENYSAQNYNIIKGELNELTFGTNKNSLTNRGEKNGGSNKSSVTKDLSYLVTNDTTSGSSKNLKAAKLGIPVIDEKAFLSLLG